MITLHNKKYYTYKIFSNCFSPIELKNIEDALSKRGNWKKITSHTTNVSFLFVYYCGMPEPRFIYGIQSALTDTINWGKPSIANKDSFYNAFKSFYPTKCKKYMPMQYNITPNNYHDISPEIFKEPNNVWILKLSTGFGGKGIQFVTSYEQYISYVKEYSNNKNIVWAFVNYIQNLTLIRGHKFHLRVPLIYYNKNGYCASKSMIWTAKEKYVKDDWINTDIHDSRYRTSYSKTLLYPQDLNIEDEFREKIDNQIKKISKYVILTLNNIGIECWPKTERCFEIIGLDLLIDDNYHVWLLEINMQARIRNDDPEYAKDVIDGLLYHVVDAMFPPENKVEDNGLYIDLKLNK